MSLGGYSEGMRERQGRRDANTCACDSQSLAWAPSHQRFSEGLCKVRLGTVLSRGRLGLGPTDCHSPQEREGCFWGSEPPLHWGQCCCCGLIGAAGTRFKAPIAATIDADGKAMPITKPCGNPTQTALHWPNSGGEHSCC